METFTKNRAVVWLTVLINLVTVASGYSFGESFDFIVVGGGPGGCTVASRLSENGRFSVLLLEAGDFPNPGLEIPGLSSTYVNTRNIKTYFTEPGADTGGRTIKYQVGRVLGGGSSVNGMAFNRGSPFDWDNWANLTGDPSWRYKNMLKYFKKVEHYMGDFPSDQHGYSGHITVSRPSFAPGLETLLEAGVHLGYPTADPNGPQKLSFAPLEFSKRRGRRVSAFIGYIRPYLDIRKNLKVITGAKVERILFQAKNASITAIGVVYSTPSPGGGKQSIFVRASEEVIVSAGVIESPALLLRSGIGSEIPGTPLPGNNLHDHLLVRLIFMHNDSSQVVHKSDFNPETFAQYNATGEGPYSTHDGMIAQAFMETGFGGIEVGWADMHCPFVSSGLSIPPPEDIREGEYAVFAMLFFVRPKSRGKLTLDPSNPEGDPIVDLQYLQHPEDMEVFVDGIFKVLKIYEETPPFQKIGTRYSSVPVKECREEEFRSREYWRCYVRHKFVMGLHGGGTCKMGRKGDDPEAVVDTELRVLGVEGLRVVDASIMPQVTNANTQVPVYTIAEKAAELILQKYYSV